MAKKKLYNMYVMTLQGKPYKDRMHYTLKQWHVYPRISHKMACYLMYRNGCAYITGWSNGKPLVSLNHDQLHACCIEEARARRLTFCVTQRVKDYPQDTTGRMIHPDIPVIGIAPSPFLDTAVASTFELVIKNEHETEHSIECNQWGAEESVPKGFFMIHTSGIEIKEGDYYWDTNISHHRDCWVRVGETYSRYKPGEKTGAVNWFGKVHTTPIIIRRHETLNPET